MSSKFRAISDPRIYWSHGTPVLLPEARLLTDMFTDVRVHTYDSQMRPTHGLPDTHRSQGVGVRAGCIGAYMLGTGRRDLPNHFALAVVPRHELVLLINDYTIPIADKMHWQFIETDNGGVNITISYGQILGFKFITKMEPEEAEGIKWEVLQILKAEKT
jgi:hypothetical protein